MYYIVYNLVKRDSEALVRLFYEERTVERDYRQCLVGEELFVNKSTIPKGQNQNLGFRNTLVAQGYLLLMPRGS